jgi:hypothetical protein
VVSDSGLQPKPEIIALGRPCMSRGTGGSNPFPSTGESGIDTLIRTAIAQAGAERGLLMLSRGAEPRIGAEATNGGDTARVQLRTCP